MQHKGWQVFFFFFLIYLFAQHWLVFPYHDDWGYAVLSYTTEVAAGWGQEFSQTDLLQFLFQEYRNWSGRFFPFFLQINLFKLGLDAVRLTQVIVLAGIVLSAVVVSRRTGGVWCSLILVPVGYFIALPPFVTAGGLYWFSASIAYVWGLVLFGIALGLIVYKCDLSWPATLLVTLAALFHEQMSVAMFAFVVSYMVFLSWQHASARILLKYWPHLLIVALSGASVILAPGNYIRRAVSSYPHGGIWSTMWANANDIARFILNPEGRTAAFFAVLALIVLASRFLYPLPFRHWVLTGLGGAVMTLAGTKLFPPLLTVCLLLAGLGTLLVMGIRKGLVLPSIAAAFVAAIASLLLLLFAPGISGRSLLPFYFLMLFPIVYGVSLGWGSNAWVAASVVILAMVAVPQAVETYRCYAANAQYNKVNQAKLLSAGFDAQYHVAPITVGLYRLPYGRYAETMPYQRDLIHYWLRRYYQIPETVNFRWLEPARPSSE